MADLEQLAASDIGAFSQALKGSGVEAVREWDAVQVTYLGMESTLEDITGRIQAVFKDRYMPDAEKQQRVTTLAALGDSEIRAAEQNLKQQWPQVERLLEAAAASDLVRAEPAESALIRGEIDRHLAAATKPAQEAWGGAPFKPGQSVKDALRDLLTGNPQRFAAEITGDYGRVLLNPADHAELSKIARLTTPGTTPKAQAARATIPLAGRARAHTNHAVFQAKQALAEALKQPTADRGGYRPDFRAV